MPTCRGSTITLFLIITNPRVTNKNADPCKGRLSASERIVLLKNCEISVAGVDGETCSASPPPRGSRCAAMAEPTSLPAVVDVTALATKSRTVVAVAGRVANDRNDQYQDDSDLLSIKLYYHI